MASSGHRVPVNGTSKNITGGKCLVNGVGHEIVKGRTLIDGTGYDINFGLKLGDLPVGTGVYTTVNGVLKEFIIVNQGNPDSSLYDASCDGTWLLMKHVYEKRQWHSSNKNIYAASTIHSYLNSDFLALFDADFQNAIRQVKIPYVNGYGTNGSVASGSSGLSTKAFLLSWNELGEPAEYYFKDLGSCLSYFSNAVKFDERHNAYYNGSISSWWLRSASTGDSGFAGVMTPTAGVGTVYCTELGGVRPALILPFKTPVNSEFIIRP